MCSTIMNSFLNPGQEVVVITPSFDAIMKSAAFLGLKVKGVPLKPPVDPEEALHIRNWRVDYDALADAITPNTKLLAFNTPSSPLGKVYNRDHATQMVLNLLTPPTSTESVICWSGYNSYAKI